LNDTLVAAIIGGLIGGLSGALIVMHVTPSSRIVQESAATPPSSSVVVAKRIELLDADGKLRAELAMSPDGGPGLFFFDSRGRNRLAMGLYAATEYEAPSLVLNNPDQQAAGIFRLFGPRDTPVVVLKSQGRDRSIYGLDVKSSEPFLTNFSGNGTQSDVFGHH